MVFGNVLRAEQHVLLWSCEQGNPYPAELYLFFINSGYFYGLSVKESRAMHLLTS